MYSSYSFTTSALDADEWSASRPGRALPPKGTPVPTIQLAGWSPEPVWTQKVRGKSLASAGDRTSIARSSRHYTDWATAPPVCHRRYKLQAVELKQLKQRYSLISVPDSPARMSPHPCFTCSLRPSVSEAHLKQSPSLSASPSRLS
jgi:hypothetical protein